MLLSCQVDTELVYAYAKTEDMGALEEFMSGQHQANLQSVGDRVFDEGLYEAARAIFAHIPNWGRLASTLVRLHQFQQAVDAARKANSPRTWKEVSPSSGFPFTKQASISWWSLSSLSGDESPSRHVQATEASRQHLPVCARPLCSAPGRRSASGFCLLEKPPPTPSWHACMCKY